MMVDKDDQQLPELLSAYLDGELNDEELAYVERTLESDEDARRLLEELRRTVAVVANLPRRSAPVALTEDINAQLERRALLGDTGAATPVASAGSRSSWSTLLSMAAGLAIVCTGVVWYAYNPTDGDLAMVESRAPEVDKVVSAKRTNARGSRKKTTPAPPAVPAGKQIDVDALMAVADLARLVAVDGRVSHLRAHRFKNEDINLTIAARDGAEAKTLSQRFVSALRSASVADASPSNDRTPLRKLASQGFFLKGRSGVNFEGRAGEQQILVRLSPRERDRLFAEMAQWPDVEGRAVLRSGPVRIRGLERSRLALAGAERSGSAPVERRRRAAGRGPVETRAEEAESTEGSTEPVGPGFDLNVLAELAKILTTSPEAKEVDPDVSSDTTMPSDLRDDSAPAIAAKSAKVAQSEADAMRAPSPGDGVVARLDASGMSRASRFEPKSLVEKKMEELAPARAKRVRRRPSRLIMPGRMADEAVASADKRTLGFVTSDAAASDEFVTLVFRFVPPKPPKPRPASPGKSAGTVTKDKPAKKIDSIKK